MKILPNNSSLIYSGRIDVSDPFAIVWTYPGTFVRMKFKGTQLFIHVRNKHNYWNNYLGVAEGDAQTKLLLPEEGEAMIEIPLQTTQKQIQNITESIQTAGIPMRGSQHENLMHSCMTSLRVV